MDSHYLVLFSCGLLCFGGRIVLDEMMCKTQQRAIETVVLSLQLLLLLRFGSILDGLNAAKPESELASISTLVEHQMHWDWSPSALNAPNSW